MAHVLLSDVTVVLTPEMYLRSTAESDFEPSSFGTSELLFPSQPQSPEVISSGVVDRGPPVSLDDG